MSTASPSLFAPSCASSVDAAALLHPHSDKKRAEHRRCSAILLKYGQYAKTYKIEKPHRGPPVNVFLIFATSVLRKEEYAEYYMRGEAVRALPVPLQKAFAGWAWKDEGGRWRWEDDWRWIKDRNHHDGGEWVDWETFRDHHVWGTRDFAWIVLCDCLYHILEHEEAREERWLAARAGLYEWAFERKKRELLEAFRGVISPEQHAGLNDRAWEAVEMIPVQQLMLHCICVTFKKQLRGPLKIPNLFERLGVDSDWTRNGNGVLHRLAAEGDSDKGLERARSVLRSWDDKKCLAEYKNADGKTARDAAEEQGYTRLVAAIDDFLAGPGHAPVLEHEAVAERGQSVASEQQNPQASVVEDLSPADRPQTRIREEETPTQR